MNYVMLAGALALAGGCKDKSDDARQGREAAPLAIEADEAQRSADEKADEAQRRAGEKADDARRAAEKKADEAKQASEDQFSQQRAETLGKLHDQLEAADRKTDHLREKMGAASGATKENAKAAAQEVQKRRAAVEADLAKLEMTNAADFDSARAEAERSLVALDRAVENFEKTL